MKNKRYHITAVFKLHPTPEKNLNTDSVELEVEAKHIIDLSSLFSEAILASARKLGTSRLNVISIKLSRENNGYKFIANVLLKDVHHKVEFTDKAVRFKPLDLYRLFQYMEVKAIASKGDEFESMIHLRVVPLEKNDIPAKKF
jgi:hypothetical protein